MHRKWPGGLVKAVSFSSEHPGDWKFAREVQQKRLRNSHIFRSKTSVFSRFSVRGDTPHGFGVFWDVFHSILGTRGSQIGPKSVRFQKFAPGTLIYFTCFDGFAGLQMQFLGFNLNLHATYQLNQGSAGHLLPGYEVNFPNLNRS